MLRSVAVEVKLIKVALLICAQAAKGDNEPASKTTQMKVIKTNETEILRDKSDATI